MVRADGAVFEVFCEPGLGIKIKGRLWDRPFCIRNRKPPIAAGLFKALSRRFCTPELYP